MKSDQTSILIVEDEPDICLVLSDLLEQEGYQVQRAANGREALSHIQQYPYDAVLLDIRLPDLEGITTLQTLAKWEPGLPIIVLSAIPSLEKITGPLVERGAFAYLPKPFNPDTLRTTIRQAIGDKALAPRATCAQHP